PEGGTVDVGIGRFGPYDRHGRTYASIPKDRFVLDVPLPEALELLQKKTARGGGALRELGVDERTGEVVDVREGSYGPYGKRGKLSAPLPRDVSPEEVPPEQARALLAARAAAAAARGGAGAKRGRGAGAKKAASGKGAARSGTAKKATGGKKATSKTRTVKGATRRTNARKTKTA